MHIISLFGVAFAALLTTAYAATCPGVPAPTGAFQLATGWKFARVATDLMQPRDMVFDSKGRLLVVESIWGIRVNEVASNGCITSSRLLNIAIYDVTHGIYFSPDGLTLYASTSKTVYSWAYNAATGTVGPQTIVVDGMLEDYGYRTLVIPPNRPNLLVVSHPGYSDINITLKKGIVKTFDLTKKPAKGFNFIRDGWNAGYGLRDTEGLAFDGNNMLWGVDNSPSDLKRKPMTGKAYTLGDNPAAELNYLGDASVASDKWFGYPLCYTVGKPSELTDKKFKVGDQFVDAPTLLRNDASCNGRSVAPRLTLPAQSTPIGSKFDAGFKNLYVTLNGREANNPLGGSKLISIPFKKGSTGAYEPVAPADSVTGYSDIFYQIIDKPCTGSVCIRPVGLAFDKAGRIYMSTRDGDIYLLLKPT